MSMENAIPYEELDRRRKKSIASRKLSMAPPPPPLNEHESESMHVINEIFNPSLKIPTTVGPYRVPDAVQIDDLDALKDLDINKLAELKEVFLLFDTDCDGLISKDDLRFTFLALGNEAPEEMLEQMLKEAKDPLDYDAFVELMSHRTIELDPEDVLLEAWSKWDDHGTGKIEEKNCTEYIEIFPYLRDANIENTTTPEYVLCNRSNVANNNETATITANFNSSNQNNNNNSNENGSSNMLSIDDLQSMKEFIYSAAKVLGIRVRFRKQPTANDLSSSILNITGEYRFLKRDNFRNDGRLIAGSYCDYYYFASADANVQMLDIWQYFHSPRFPANYPAHIKCSYKFIGRPENCVEIVFEELHIPRHPQEGCNLDKLTIFDAESANMNAVIDVICDAMPARRIISSGPDLLIEFNASSNLTSKGFRGKFRFPHSNGGATATAVRPGSRDSRTLANESVTALDNATASFGALTAPTEIAFALEKISLKKQTTSFNSIVDGKKFFKSNENCKQTFDSRNNKSGTFDNWSLLPAVVSSVNIIPVSNIFPGRLQCRYEFIGEPFERVQIKFLEFNLPAEQKNSSECKSSDSLQILTQVRGKYEASELFCGSSLPRQVMSHGPKLLLQYVGKYYAMGSKTNYHGFRAEYKFTTNYGITTGIQKGIDCFFIYNSTIKKSGWFGSPNYPGLYPQNLICNYYFYGELEENIHIRFTYFDVEGVGTCEYQTASDYVEFSNFLTTDRKFPRFCGKRDKFEITSDSRFFRITFYSNDRFDKTGFRALYDFESSIIPVDITSVQSYVSDGCKKLFISHYILIFIIFVLPVRF